MTCKQLLADNDLLMHITAHCVFADIAVLMRSPRAERLNVAMAELVAFKRSWKKFKQISFKEKAENKR